MSIAAGHYSTRHRLRKARAMLEQLGNWVAPDDLAACAADLSEEGWAALAALAGVSPPSPTTIAIAVGMARHPNTRGLTT